MKKTTPLINAMINYVKNRVKPFHTPGHKMGKGIHSSFEEIIPKKSLAFDLGLMYELDDFHAPSTCIKEAQDKAAKLYGADESFFLINGTTCGIYSMIMTIVGPGEKIIVPRNAHRSVIGGIILAGAIPVYINPVIDNDLKIAMNVTVEEIKKAIDINSDAKGVLIVHPTYYGVASDLKQISDLVHEKNMRLIVDGAHGPHLKFSKELPIQALDSGADIVAQSTHKITGALTQCSMLHCKYGNIDIERLRTMLRINQSTSPNYFLLASLDAAREQMEQQGNKLISKAIELANWARNEINKIKGLYCFGLEKIDGKGFFAFDPMKLTVNFQNTGLTAVEVESILRNKYKIQVELVDLYNVLFLVTIGDEKENLIYLVQALDDLIKKYIKKIDIKEISFLINEYHSIPKQIILPRDAIFKKRRKIKFDESIGLIAGEMITFYPPGIPIIAPGEQITKELIEYCIYQKNNGLKVSGPEDCNLTMINVIES